MGAEPPDRAVQRTPATSPIPVRALAKDFTLQCLTQSPHVDSGRDPLGQ
jgi:hypothetical protein